MRKVCFFIVLVVVLTGCRKQGIAPEYDQIPVENSVIEADEEMNRLQEEQLRQQQLREEELSRQKREQALLAVQEQNRLEREQVKRLEMEKSEEQKKEMRLVESKRIFFDFDSFELNEDARTTLQIVARVMRGLQNLKLRVEGYCDERGTSEYNMALGERRARAVLDFLVVLGVDSSRLRILSFGEENPLEIGHSESAWAMNRRVEFYFLK